MKKIYILILSLFILQGCFWNSAGTQTGLILQDKETFSILIPENWNEIGESNIPTPRSGKVALAYRSDSERQGYLNNIIVLETPSKSQESSESLMKNSLQSLQKNIENFTIISEKIITFADQQTGILLTYSGKYNDTTPETVYIQTARVCGDNSYYLTLSLAQQLESYDRYEYILQTFRCN